MREKNLIARSGRRTKHGGMAKSILHVVTNTGHYAGTSQPTGLWLSELTHAWDVFAEAGFAQEIVSPFGGVSPLEPRALKWPLADRSARAWRASPERMVLLSQTLAPGQIDPGRHDAIFFTGGHGVMWDFPDSAGLQAIAREIWERGGIVSAVCHGYCGLLNLRLSDGGLLVAGKRITGFSWREEVLAGVAAKMPYDAEAEMRRRGAQYSRGLLPFAPHVVADGRLITGQNPASAKATARRIARHLAG